MEDDELDILLLNEVYKEIYREFEKKHLSGNLMGTMMFTDGGKTLLIPANRYDIYKYRNEGVFIYTNNGSYASDIDLYGSIFGNHKDYIERCISIAINKWIAKNGLEVESIEWK